jgi:hypothetical protein
VNRLTFVVFLLVRVGGRTVLVLGVVVVRARVHVHVLGQCLPPGGKQDRHEQAREPPLHRGSLWDASGAVNEGPGQRNASA